MAGGVRFADVLEDALKAVAWEGHVPEEPRVRVEAFRHAVSSPIYNLHTITVDAERVRAAAAAYGSGVTFGCSPDMEADIRSQERSTSSTRRMRSEAASGACTPAAARIHPGVPASTRPCRRLTEQQRRSFDAFNRLGAALGTDFTAVELRSAFRRLARRYHPDRHPHAARDDRERLSQQFTIVRADYDTLLTALEPPVA